MIIEDKYEEPEVYQNIDFDDIDGELGGNNYKIMVREPIANQGESTFAQMLE